MFYRCHSNVYVHYSGLSSNISIVYIGKVSRTCKLEQERWIASNISEYNHTLGESILTTPDRRCCAADLRYRKRSHESARYNAGTVCSYETWNYHCQHYAMCGRLRVKIVRSWKVARGSWYACNENYLYNLK